MALAFSLRASAQKTLVVDSTDPNFRTVIAGPEYKKSSLHQFLWGKHYRKEWTTPVRVPVIDLAKEEGGLVPVEQGGGRQTQTLRLQDRNGRQFVLRSIDKDYGKALPDYARGTFIQDLAKDQVSTAHPFAAVTIPRMIDAAGVFHTNPRIVFVPYSPILGKYNETFAGTLCLFEERPDEDQSTAPNFGYAEDVKGTEKMYEKVFGENDHRVDQRAFVRARLFDMFLGDWGRHDDQWRWGKFDSADYTIYRPIPRDRDQAYTKFDGFLIKKILGNEDLEHLQTFSYKIRNVKKYNFPARYIDRQLTNEVTREEWIDIAHQLQTALTDTVIEESVRQMPPELFAISGNEIIAKLKSRRNELAGYAEKYYGWINKRVEVVGTRQSEYFELRNTDGGTQLNIYDRNKEGEPKKHPFYSRTFSDDETKEIRLYGLDGNDVYHIEGGDSKIKLRVIGGIGTDSLVNNSSQKVRYYDNPGNPYSGKVRAHLSSDTAINRYEYRAFVANSGYTIKRPFYSNTRGIFLEAGYTYTRQQWRKQPFGWSQTLTGNYSISNNSFGGEYAGIFNQVIGKWNILVHGRYDQKLKNYFFGLGNETSKDHKIEYYQLFTREGYASLGFNREFAKYHSVTLTGFWETFKIVRENAKLLDEVVFLVDPTVFQNKDFAGGTLNYTYYRVNNMAVPTKGFGISLNGGHTENLTTKGRSFERYSADLGFYLPFTKTISLAVRAGGATVNGQPEFYQLNWLGGGQNLRGFHRQRFYGKQAFYDDNELRWLPYVHGRIFSGTLGLVAFLDNGRVWNPGEDSNTWHFGYGGGVLIAPFNKVSVTVYYGTSKDDALLHIRLGRFF